MDWTAPPLPRPPAPPPTPPAPWLIAQYRLLANAMLAAGDWEHAADYEERALVGEHQEALRQAAPATAT